MSVTSNPSTGKDQAVQCGRLRLKRHPPHLTMVVGDNARFHNMETFHPSIGCTGRGPGGVIAERDNFMSPGHVEEHPRLSIFGWESDRHMQAPNKVGRRHNHFATANRDHIVFSGSQATWRTSADMYGMAPEQQPPWTEQQDNIPASAASPPATAALRQSSNRSCSDHAEERSRTQSIGHAGGGMGDLHKVPGVADTNCAVPAELEGRKPEQALELLRAALAKRGVHGALEFAQQLRSASTMTPSGQMIGFTDIGRVVTRFCKMADAYIHAIFRALDKDCYGCVSVAELLDNVFVRLTTRQMNQVKIVFAVRPRRYLVNLAIHEVAMGDMDIRTVLQLEQFKNHVDHISGNKSKATLIGEFADCIAADTLTWEKFLFYYRALATSTMGNDISFTQSVKDTWRVQYPLDEAAAATRATSLTEPSPVYTLPHGSLRRFPQALHVGASPVFNPTTYTCPAPKKQGKACEFGGRGKQSAVYLG